MAQLDSKPDPFQRRQQSLSANDLNQMLRAILRQIRGGTNTDVSYYGDRVTIESGQVQPQLPGPENYLAQFVILEVLDDTLRCAPFVQPFDSTETFTWQPQSYDPDLGSDSSVILFIAKPYDLQKTPWQGSGLNTDVHNITPAYIVGEVITAYRASSGYVDPNTNSPLTWIDLNTAGRSTSVGPVAQMSVTGINPNVGPFLGSTITFDQATGFHTTSGPSLALYAATATQWGVVSTLDQTWSGVKTLLNTISGDTNAMSADGFLITDANGNTSHMSCPPAMANELILESNSAAGGSSAINMPAGVIDLATDSPGGPSGAASLTLWSDPLAINCFATLTTVGILTLAGDVGINLEGSLNAENPNSGGSGQLVFGDLTGADGTALYLNTLGNTGIMLAQGVVGADLATLATRARLRDHYFDVTWLAGNAYYSINGTLGVYGTDVTGSVVAGGIITAIGTGVAWASIISPPTTITGYGITDLTSGSYYTPGNSGDWSGSPPTTFQEVYDRLAAALVLAGFTP